MADIIKMPKLGFDMAEGTLIRWVIADGDKVEKGELLAEIETDKATVEVESMFTGTIHKHLVAEGASVPVSQPIAVVADDGEDFDLDALLGDLRSPAQASELAGGADVAEAMAAVHTSVSAPCWNQENGISHRQRSLLLDRVRR